jgi:hypothetical protein
MGCTGKVRGLGGQRVVGCVLIGVDEVPRAMEQQLVQEIPEPSVEGPAMETLPTNWSRVVPSPSTVWLGNSTQS